MTTAQMALLICVAPFVGLAFLAWMADLAMALWPASEAELREWEEMYN